MRVHQLMDRTWYRKPDHRIGSLTWGFQDGHTLPSPGREERWIEAASEVIAMDRLLQELEEGSLHAIHRAIHRPSHVRRNTEGVCASRNPSDKTQKAPDVDVP